MGREIHNGPIKQRLVNEASSPIYRALLYSPATLSPGGILSHHPWMGYLGLKEQPPLCLILESQAASHQRHALANAQQTITPLAKRRREIKVIGQAAAVVRYRDHKRARRDVLEANLYGAGEGVLVYIV